MIDPILRAELLLANYAAMIQHLAELERKMAQLESTIKSWN